MKCPACQHENPDGSQFCNGCGQPIVYAQPSPSSAAPEEERLVWEGSCSTKSLINLWWILSFLLVIPLLIFFIVAWYKRSSRHYRLTTERLTVTTGFFGRQSEDVKLVRIEDIAFSQSFFNRIMGVGDLCLISTDKTDPDLHITGVAEPEKLKETIWNLVREVRKKMVYMEQLNA